MLLLLAETCFIQLLNSSFDLMVTITEKVNLSLDLLSMVAMYCRTTY